MLNLLSELTILPIQSAPIGPGSAPDRTHIGPQSDTYRTHS